MRRKHFTFFPIDLPLQLTDSEFELRRRRQFYNGTSLATRNQPFVLIIVNFLMLAVLTALLLPPPSLRTFTSYACIT